MRHAAIAGDELGKDGDAVEIFVDRHALLERMADADVARREIDRRDAAGGPGTTPPTRTARRRSGRDRAAARGRSRTSIATGARAGVDLARGAADGMVAAGRIVERDR